MNVHTESVNSLHSIKEDYSVVKGSKMIDLHLTYYQNFNKDDEYLKTCNRPPIYTEYGITKDAISTANDMIKAKYTFNDIKDILSYNDFIGDLSSLSNSEKEIYFKCLTSDYRPREEENLEQQKFNPTEQLKLKNKPYSVFSLNSYNSYGGEFLTFPITTYLNLHPKDYTDTDLELNLNKDEVYMEVKLNSSKIMRQKVLSLLALLMEDLLNHIVALNKSDMFDNVFINDDLYLEIVFSIVKGRLSLNSTRSVNQFPELFTDKLHIPTFCTLLEMMVKSYKSKVMRTFDQSQNFIQTLRTLTKDDVHLISYLYKPSLQQYVDDVIENALSTFNQEITSFENKLTNNQVTYEKEELVNFNVFKIKDYNYDLFLFNKVYLEDLSRLDLVNSVEVFRSSKSLDEKVITSNYYNTKFTPNANILLEKCYKDVLSSVIQKDFQLNVLDMLQYDASLKSRDFKNVVNYKEISSQITTINDNKPIPYSEFTERDYLRLGSQYKLYDKLVNGDKQSLYENIAKSINKIPKDWRKTEYILSYLVYNDMFISYYPLIQEITKHFAHYLNENISALDGYYFDKKLFIEDFEYKISKLLHYLLITEPKYRYHKILNNTRTELINYINRGSYYSSTNKYKIPTYEEALTDNFKTVIKSIITVESVNNLLVKVLDTFLEELKEPTNINGGTNVSTIKFD